MTKLVLIGEAFGEAEASLQSPFVGPAGQELARMLHGAGYPVPFIPYTFNSPIRMVRFWDSFPFKLLNVFNEHPPGNDVQFFYEKPDAKQKEGMPRRFDNSIYYVKPEHLHHVAQLQTTLLDLKPNLIVALGNTALWALGLPATVSKLRGNVVNTPYGKVLPTFHPASVLRNWHQRVISILDLHKALRESATPSLSTLAREVWIEPSIADLYDWWELYGSKTELLAFDIETIRNKQISEISFASDSTHAIHIPFFYKRAGKYISWWPDAKTEVAAWRFVKSVCESDVNKIGQNCIQYDCFWMLKEMNIVVKNIKHDTMQLSHAWQPELEKSLGFLGSIFLDETSWKHIRTETNKQND